jgi:hypothetical protein
MTSSLFPGANFLVAYDIYLINTNKLKTKDTVSILPGRNDVIEVIYINDSLICSKKLPNNNHCWFII